MADQLAALDLGSNSFHMIVARLGRDRLKILDKMREGVRLGAGLDADGRLTEEAQRRALDCLERFAQRVRSLGAGHVRAVGTNTLRKARNGREFVEKAQLVLGHPIEIIGGREEARLIYLGVAQTNAATATRRLVVDIGGGSTECIIGKGFDILDADSLFMGCVSYSGRYFADGRVTAQSFEDAEIAAQLELQSIVGPYTTRGWKTALGCSGTVHAIHGIVTANGWSDGGITKKSLKRLKKALITAGSMSSVQLAGLDEDRKPVLAGGLAILKAIFDALDVEGMQPSPGALREGLLYDLVGRIQHEDVRDRTIDWFVERYEVDVEQARRVEELALTLLRQVDTPWGLARAESEQLLGWAARMHEIGMTISHTAHHKHGAYIVSNADMAGFSRDGQRLLATLVRTQRRKLRPEDFAAVPPARRELVTRLAALFRLAVLLNRNRSSKAVPKLVARARKKTGLVLAFPAGWLAEHPLTDTDLRREAAQWAALGLELGVREAK